MYVMELRMSTLLVAVALFSLTKSTAQLIPNGNVESWGDFGQFYESPEHWITSNTETEQAVFKDMDANEGMYSMRVESVNFGAGGYGEAAIGIPFDGDSLTLSGWVKGVIDGNAQISVSLEKYESGVFVSFASWFSNTTVADWEEISVVSDGAACDSVVVRVVAVGGDFAFGEAVMWADAMSMDGISTDVDDMHSEIPYFVYSSSSQEIRFRPDLGMLEEISLYDLQGKRVLTGNSSNILSTSNLPASAYVLVYSSTTGTKSAKVMVR